MRCCRRSEFTLQSIQARLQTVFIFVVVVSFEMVNNITSVSEVNERAHIEAHDPYEHCIAIGLRSQLTKKKETNMNSMNSLF